MASKQKSAAESIRDTMDFLENIGAPFSDRSEEDWAKDPKDAEPTFKIGEKVCIGDYGTHTPDGEITAVHEAEFDKPVRYTVQVYRNLNGLLNELSRRYDADGKLTADDDGEVDIPSEIMVKQWDADHNRNPNAGGVLELPEKCSAGVCPASGAEAYIHKVKQTESVFEDAFDYRVGDKVCVGPNSADGKIDGEIIGFEDGVEGRKWKINVFDNLNGILNELSRQYNNDGDQVVDGGKADIPSDIEIMDMSTDKRSGILLLPEKSTEGEDFASGSDTYFRKAKEPGATPSESIRASLNFLENIVNEYSTGSTPNPYHYGTKPQNKEKTVKPTGLIGDQTTTTSDNTDHYTKNGFFGGG